MATAAPAGRHWGVDRERAETHLRLLAEAELRRVMTMPAGSILGRRHPAPLALAAQALTAVDAVGADAADQIQADVSLAVAARRRTVARGPRPGRLQPARRRASWRVVPVGQVIRVRDGGIRRDVPVMAYAQSAGGARFITADWLFGPLTVTAADDQGVSYQISWAGEMAPRELLLRPDPRHQIRWLDLTADPGQPATRIDLDRPSSAPAPGVTATQDSCSPGELLLDVIAARILTATAPLARGNPGPQAATDGLRAFVGDGPGHIVTALHAAGLLPPTAQLVGHDRTATTESVYRREIRPALTQGAEVMTRSSASRLGTDDLCIAG